MWEKRKKEIEEDIRKLKDLPWSCLDKINFVKRAILLKAIYRFNVMPIKISANFFTHLKRTILNFIWKRKKKAHDSQNSPVQKKDSLEAL